MPKHVTRDVFDSLQVLYDHQAYFQSASTGQGTPGGRLLMGAGRGTQADADVLAYGDLAPGDIIFHNDSKWTAFSRSHRFKSKHCSLMIDRQHRAHAVPIRGVIKSSMVEFKDPGLVFRIKAPSKSYAREAARLAILMTSGNKTTEDFGKYSRKRLWGGMLFGHKFGTGARARLEKYADDDHRRFGPKNVTCAEFVVLCYQMASDNNQQASFIQLDAKHTMPWSLEEYLLQNSTDWDLVGRIRGSECYQGGAHH